MWFCFLKLQIKQGQLEYVLQENTTSVFLLNSFCYFPFLCNYLGISSVKMVSNSIIFVSAAFNLWKHNDFSCPPSSFHPGWLFTWANLCEMTLSKWHLQTHTDRPLESAKLKLAHKSSSDSIRLPTMCIWAIREIKSIFHP